MKYEKKRQNEKTIITISVTVVLLVVVLSVGFILGPSMVSSGNPQNTPAPSVTPTPLVGEPIFYDEALLQAVQSALGIDTVPTAAQMQELEILDCGDVEINELIGLEYAINLKELTMKFAGVSIDPILDIQIEKLKIMSDTSVQPLLDDIRYMSCLKYLDLTDCGITGLVVYCGGAPIGNLIAYAQGDTLYYPYAKADNSYFGISVYMYIDLAKKFDTQYVNLGSDGGIEGIRHFKGKFRPYILTDKYFTY